MSVVRVVKNGTVIDTVRVSTAGAPLLGGGLTPADVAAAAAEGASAYAARADHAHGHGVALDSIEHDGRDHAGVPGVIGKVFHRRSGREYFGWTSAAPSNATPAQNQLLAYPIVVTRQEVWDRIGLRIATGAAGATVRLGVYSADTGSQEPGDLLLDAGSVDASVGGTDQRITIALTVQPDVYWLAAVSQGGTPVVWGLPDAKVMLGGNFGLSATRAHKANGEHAGALPDPFPVGIVGANETPHAVFVRAA